MRTIWPVAKLACLGALLAYALVGATAQEPAPSAGEDAVGQAKSAAGPQGGLADEQRQVADRFRELEKLLLRMAELTAPTDPRRAALLRQAVAQSKQRDLDHQFEELVALLRQERLAAVLKSQGEVHQDLVKLLELLLSEDRTKRIESEKERVREYLKRVNRIIKEQKSLQGETARGADEPKLAGKQGELADKTGELADDVNDKPQSKSRAEEPDDPDKDPKKEDPKNEGDDAPGDESKKSKTPSDGKPSDADKQSPDKDVPPSDGDADKKKSDDEGKQKADDADKNGDKDSGESKKSDPSGKPGGKPQQGQPQQSEGQPGEGQQGEGQPGESQQQENSPAQKRLKQAQERMREAQQKLDEAKRTDAQEKQAEAIKELEAAKAELEEILRQLREEEMARTLAMLETRFRKMLEAQIEVYEGTKRLDKVPQAERDRDDEIEAGRLSRKEAQISTEADKALAVLREEGSAVAFPEAVEEIREDMNQVVARLAEAKVGDVTQGIETDIIAALEEMIAALQKAQKDMENKAKQGPPPDGGEEDEQPLVDTLSELKMIRAMQMRINLRTERYAKLTKNEQVETPDLLEALRRLAEREQRIHQVTRDIVVGRNR